LAGIKIACLQELGRYEEEMNLIGTMLLVYSICEGTTSAEFLRLNQLKIAVVARKDEERNSKEMARKVKFCNSAVSIDLLKNANINELLPLNCSKLDFSLFN
jgi:hypothetical protein